MRISLLTPSLLLALLAPFALAEPRLEIEVQHYVQDCTQRTANGDTVSVHYRGTLASDGSEFDASYSRGRPMRFVLGAGRVIKGWDQGLLDMCVGEKRKLTIPPELGYGERAMGPIPAGSTLVFETELMGLQGKDEL